MRWLRCLRVLVASVVLVSAGCGDPFPEESGPDPGEGPEVLGPLSLTEAQLDELEPALDDVASAMSADVVEGERGGFGVIVEVPPGAAVAEWTFWAMDSGERTMGVAAVDFVSVQLVLVDNDTEVRSVMDAVVAFDAEYWRWAPREMAGAATALESEPIPYEGEPDDEPEFSSVLAHRDRLIVIVTAAGSDREAANRAASGIAEVLFDQAHRFSDQ